MATAFDTEAPFLGLDGKPQMADGKPMLIGPLAATCLLAQDNRDAQATGIDKVLVARLAEKVYAAGGNVTLTTEEATLLKEHIGRKGAPLFVARVWDMLDPPVNNVVSAAG